MSRSAALVLVFTSLFYTSVKAQNDTVNIDFGTAANASAAPWNNLTNQNSGTVANCYNYLGYATGISIAVTDSFNGINSSGLMAHDSLRITNEGAGDSFFGSAVAAVGGHQPTGTIILYHLNPSRPYNFGLFASRAATDNRDTKYVVSGMNVDSANLDAADNTDFMARINQIFPAADSTIKVKATTGINNTNISGYYYLGAVQITFVNTNPPPPKFLQLTYPNGIERWEVGKQPRIKWESNNVLNVGLDYSTNNGATWNSITSSTSALAQSYSWNIPNTVSDQCLVRIYDVFDPNVADTSNALFEIATADTATYRVVILGSSTAAGTGPSPVDSAWVWRYREYLTQKDTRFEVINLAKGGFTTYNILPTGTVITGVSQTIDTARNVTKALSYNPAAIIINMPSNDAANNYPVADQLTNYATITQVIDTSVTSLWVATPQPRNFSSAKIQIQKDMVDSTHAIYGDFAIDFWTGLHATDGSMLSAYNSGDGVHMNNAGHYILYQRVVGMKICKYILPEMTDTIVVTSIPEYSENDFVIYPNPANQFLHVESLHSDEYTISIIDISGKYLLNQTVSNKHAVLDISSIQGGFHILLIEDTLHQKMFAKPFIIE